MTSSFYLQIGNDINGEASNDNSGFSVNLSADGSVVAIGSPWNDVNGDRSGHIRIYKNVNNTWTQLGNDINGEAAYDELGYSVSLSADGSVVAVGAHQNLTGSGYVSIYKIVNGTWTKLGSDIDGEEVSDNSGRSVSLSADGNVVAVGALLANEDSSGHVRIYKNINNNWIQIGSDIDGEVANGFSGRSVSLSSDGNVVAIGADWNDGNGIDSGHVRIYENVENNWTQVGSDIDGEAAGDRSGWAVSLSADGSVVAIGAPFNDGNGRTDSGHVRIYKNVDDVWTQVGSDIDGEGFSDSSGVSVSLSSDGTIVAIGAHYNDGNYIGTESGHVRIYKNVDDVWIQLGSDIDGDPFDSSGVSVSLSADGSVIAVGAPLSSGNGPNSGNVRIYQTLDAVDDGDASFSIIGTVAVGNTLSINEATADPDGTGTLSYSWQTSSDDTNWTVVGTSPTYVVEELEDGKSIRAVITYEDTEGFNETVNTSSSIIPVVDDGDASFLISGRVAVGNTLSINEDIADPDGTGTLSYSWQTSSDDSIWTVVETNSTYVVGANEEGKSIRAVISYTDAQGFDETVITDNYSVSPSQRKTTISDAIYDEYYLDTITSIYQDYLDGQSKIPFYIHPGGDYQYVGFTDVLESKLENTLDSSFYKDFIVNIFNRIDNLIDIDFELWDHYNGSLIDIYATEYNPYESTIGAAYIFEEYVDIEFKVLDDVRENYITIVHEIGHALGLDHPNGDGFNSNYDIQDTIMSYNDNSSLEDIWFSDADIYTLQRIFGVEENFNGNASFSIRGTVEVGNTLGINEDTTDPDGTGTLSYSWQTSSDDSIWTVVGTNSTYVVGASDQGKSIRAVLSYTDAQGFNETVNTSSSRIPLADDGDGSFSIIGTVEVGNTLSINEDIPDPDGTGILSYSWQTSSDNSNWTVVGTSSTYEVEANEEGKSIRSLISYQDGQGFNETVNTSTSDIPFVDDGDGSFSINGTVAVGNTLGINEDTADPDGTGVLSYSWQTSSDSSNWTVVGTNSTYVVGANEEGKSIRAVITYTDSQGFDETVTTSNSRIVDKTASTLSDLEAYNYIASNTDLISSIGIDIDAAKSHYENYGISEGRSLTSFSATDYLAKYSDLSAAFGDDEILALKHYIEFGYAEGRTDTSSSSASGSGSSSNLTDLEAYNYIASNTDLISSIGIDIDAAKSHYENYGESQGRDLTSFSATDYLAKYSDLSAAFGDDEILALKHYIEFGYAEGRTDTSSSSASGSGSSSNLTDLEAYNYIASNTDLISSIGIDIDAAKSHYENYGESQGRDLTSFSATDYLAKYSDLSAAFGDDEILALKHYIEFGYAEGRTDTSSTVSGSGGSSNLTDFEALNYIASYGDLINAFGTDITSAKSHYTNYGKSEGRTLDDFDEWGYLASNNDLINSLGSDTTEAVKHYISFGYSEGKITNSFDATAYLNNYADLRNAFGTNEELATKHYVEYGFNEGRLF